MRKVTVHRHHPGDPEVSVSHGVISGAVGERREVFRIEAGGETLELSPAAAVEMAMAIRHIDEVKKWEESDIDD